ncbi:MAG: indolepyruvate ferredoxin oxidoreductase subunit alpha, partial [Candidatus Rokuibacteriota bacterium]
QPRFGIDPEVCTGDHSCMRFNGCPSLTLRENPDPLRDDPIAHVDETCVGCGVCGEVAHAAVLCPSFYEVRLVRNPSRWTRLVSALRMRVIRRLAAIDMGGPDMAPPTLRRSEAPWGTRGALDST